jgi:hypothetical protein
VWDDLRGNELGMQDFTTIIDDAFKDCTNHGKGLALIGHESVKKVLRKRNRLWAGARRMGSHCEKAGIK